MTQSPPTAVPQTPAPRDRGFPWLSAAIFLGLVAALVGYRHQPPLFQSSGLIEIKPALPFILEHTARNDPIPMFDQFMEAQVRRILSRRTVDMAMQNASWIALNRGTGEPAATDFVKHLTSFRSGQLIEINFTDPDPRVAVVAVQAMVQAYRKLYDDYTNSDESIRADQLSSMRGALSNDIQQYSARIAAIAGDYMPEALLKIYDIKIEALMRAETEYRQAELHVKLADAARRPSATMPSLTTPQQLADAGDQTMKDLLRDRESLKAEIAARNDPTIVATQVRLNEVNKQIESYLKDYQEKLAQGMVRLAGSELVALPGSTNWVSLESLRQRETEYKQLLDLTRAEAIDLGHKIQQIKSLETDRQATQQRLDEVKRNLEILVVESRVGGRLSIVSDGDLPTAPSQDPRKTNALRAGLATMLGTLALGGVIRLMTRNHHPA